MIIVGVPMSMGVGKEGVEEKKIIEHAKFYIDATLIELDEMENDGILSEAREVVYRLLNEGLVYGDDIITPQREKILKLLGYHYDTREDLPTNDVANTIIKNKERKFEKRFFSLISQRKSAKRLGFDSIRDYKRALRGRKNSRRRIELPQCPKCGGFYESESKCKCGIVSPDNFSRNTKFGSNL